MSCWGVYVSGVGHLVGRIQKSTFIRLIGLRKCFQKEDEKIDMWPTRRTNPQQVQEVNNFIIIFGACT